MVKLGFFWLFKCTIHNFYYIAAKSTPPLPFHSENLEFNSTCLALLYSWEPIKVSQKERFWKQMLLSSPIYSCDQELLVQEPMYSLMKLQMKCERLFCKASDDLASSAHKIQDQPSILSLGLKIVRKKNAVWRKLFWVHPSILVITDVFPLELADTTREIIGKWLRFVLSWWARLSHVHLMILKVIDDLFRAKNTKWYQAIFLRTNIFLQRYISENQNLQSALFPVFTFWSLLHTFYIFFQALFVKSQLADGTVSFENATIRARYQ